jgi:hypothetical protein
VPERASGALAYHVLDAMPIEESITDRRPVVVQSTAEAPPTLPADWDPYARTL